MQAQRRIRVLWLSMLFTALDAWIAVTAMWLLAVFVRPEHLESMARTLSWLSVIGVMLTMLFGMLLMHQLPRLPASTRHHGELLNVRNCLLIMWSALAAIFLCLLYMHVNG